MTHRFAVVPAAYVFLLRSQDASHEVLLQLRQNTGYRDGHWAAAAAGHVERGESVFQAAEREAREEIGVQQVALQPLCAMHRTGGTGLAIDERVDYFFASRSWRGTPRIVEPEKCADLRWFDLERLPDPVVPHELEVLMLLRDNAVPPILTHGF
jgi:8-oxo-dGTP diphosphatase